MFDIDFDSLKFWNAKEIGGMVMSYSKHMLAALMILSLGVLLMGCGQAEKTDQTAETQEMKPSVERSSQVTLNAVVEAVDYTARTFTLKDETGSSQSFQVRNPSVPLEKLKKGDNVTMTIYEEELAFVAAPGTELPSDEEIKAVGTTEGDITVANVKQMTSTVQEIDVETRMATLVDEDGTPLTISVREDVKNLDKVKVGDKVVTQITQVVSVSINK
jgi:hypothetical protein